MANPGLKRLSMLLTLMMGAGVSFLPAPAAEWKLVFQDDFERAKPGPMYSAPSRGGELSIADGRLLLVGSGAATMLDRGFAPDARLEFDSEAWAERPPCDLSVMLHSVYLLGFGARGNLANHLVGPGLRVVDDAPPFLIETGKPYHMVAEREGRRITYTVNGTKILEATSDNLLGGSSFDRIGFITWGGMLIDNVRLSERSERHPDTPVYITSLPGLPLEREGRGVTARGELSGPAREALQALNDGDLERARRLFEGLENVTLRLAGLAHVYGDLNYVERPVPGNLGSSVDFGELGAFAAQWEQAVRDHPDREVLKAYLPAIRHFGRLVYSRSGRTDAKILVDLGPEHNPFYHKARLFQARYIYWDGMEGGNAEVKNQAGDIMRELIKLWPDNRVLNEYVGEPVPWGEALNADPSAHPAWAAYLREAYAREVAVMERFCDVRQMPDGQFGGGWGDDVEMMRSWVPIAAISTCSTKILDGIERLTEGIWTHQAPRGYYEGIGDVEHTAEPTADTFPTMLLLRYGDPRYHAFNLASCRIMRDVMMGIDEKGYPRFRSTEIGAKGVNTQLFGGGDTGYHARAMKHYYWLAWYGNAEAAEGYVRWADGWRNAVMIDAPDKPAGLAPGTLWYPSGSYEPPNGEPWYSEKARNYYGVGGLPVMIHQAFLAAYSLTGDRAFLRPVQRMMDLASWGPYAHDPDARPPSMEWVRQQIVGHSDAKVTSLYRMLTGERVYDEYTRRFGTAPQVYQIDHDLDRYMARIERAAKSLRHNLWYYSTEVLSTDRLHLPAVPEVWGAYTGAVSTTVDAETPTMGVTYETPDANFAALVTENTPTRLRVWLYSFWAEPTEITLKLWRLAPGEYILNQGPLQPGEQPFQHRYRWGDPQSVAVLHKAEPVAVTLPPGVVWVVDLRLDREIEVPDAACDLAVHPRDVQVRDGRVVVTVHNLGSAPAEGFAVGLQVRERDEWTTQDEKLVARLSQTVEFQPFTTEVSFGAPSDVTSRDYRVVLDPDDALFELCETNNVAIIQGE